MLRKILRRLHNARLAFFRERRIRPALNQTLAVELGLPVPHQINM